MRRPCSRIPLAIAAAFRYEANTASRPQPASQGKGRMEKRWGLPLIAWPSRLRPNAWDLVALPLVLGGLALIAWGGFAMGARYEVGETLSISLDPWRLPEYALRTVLRMVAALIASLVFSLV